MGWTIGFDDPLASDPGRSGGKGAGLACLTRAGLPIPDGFIVLADAMAAALGPSESPAVWSDAAVRAEAARRAERLMSEPFPEGLEREISDRLRTLPGPYAVRSSAQDEDGLLRSGAGQHETVLRVPAEGVLDALRRCWASVHGHRAAIYRARTGLPPFGARAAVVVQTFIPSELGGVAFTADPVSGARRLVVEVARGGAEKVVSGEAVLERHERALPLASRASSPSIAALDPPRSSISAIDSRGSLSRAAAALDPPRSSMLGEERLRVLAELASRAEAALGRAADIEWCWSDAKGPVLLQLRPITARSVRRGPRRRPGILWTQRFSGERWTEPATMLGWSIVEPALSRYTHWGWASRRHLRGTGAARLHHGIPYFNVTIFRHLLFKTPWTPTPEFVLELFPADEQEELRARRWLLPNPGLVALVIAEAVLRGRWRGHRWLWFTNARDWNRLAGKIEAAVAVQPGPPFGELDRLLVWLDRYVGVHVWSLLYANLFYQVLGVMLERWGGRELHRLRPSLVAGAGRENLTMRTNAAVWRLAATAHATPAVESAIVGAANGLAALGALSPMPEAAAFRRELDALLASSGHRSRATWEVFSPRWRDEPQAVVEMVRSFLHGGISADPLLREEEMVAARAAAERDLDARLSGPKRALARWALRHARTFSLLRENQRFVFDRLMLAIREAARRIGADLERDRRLARAADVTWLTLSETRELAGGRLSSVEAARRIARRKLDAATFDPATAPTFLYDEGGPEWLPGPGRRVLKGLGVSPGRYTGPVRVARSLSDLASLKKGEILVVKATDPGWTPYFASAGGLVTELGGLLSHAAVVAREYGLPAVANVADATAVLHDGQEITVDGEHGFVYGPA